jgi:hypothetical protein
MGLTIFDESRAAFIENILTGNNEVVGVAVQQPCALFARTGTVDLAFDFLEKFTQGLLIQPAVFEHQYFHVDRLAPLYCSGGIATLFSNRRKQVPAIARLR